MQKRTTSKFLSLSKPGNEKLTCQMFHQMELSARGAVTCEHAPPNNITFGGWLCIMSKKSLLPTAMSHYKYTSNTHYTHFLWGLAEHIDIITPLHLGVTLEHGISVIVVISLHMTNFFQLTLFTFEKQADPSTMTMWYLLWKCNVICYADRLKKWHLFLLNI